MSSDQIKKFSSQECLESLIQNIKNDPSLIRNHIHLYTAEQVNEFGLNLWPAVFDVSNWERLSTKRPSKDKSSSGGFDGGTDREIRTYENTFWVDSGKILEGVVTTEMGEVISVEVRVVW